ncbi:putative leucine-rich repeat-containing protein DDB_G0290503 [Parasteatoda tepidariorum]|uniref:putative leucine-rich repeat-containing protein DDB_G0290503 n=1 Tax=Parasteatoda tepidariorum TaxID=114398 RepID=UPI0039BD8E91
MNIFFLQELPKIAKELSAKSSPTNSKESPASNWEDLFRALLRILSDGNILVRSLKKADIHIRYQAAKIYSSWEECFKIAVDKRLSEVQKELKDSETLKRIATDLSKRFQLTHQKRDFKDIPESYSSASWSKSLVNNYEGHIKRLTSVIEAKKNEECETSQEADVSPVETDKEMKLFLEIQPEEHNLLGKKIVVKAIELKNEEIEMMQNKLDQLEEPVISDTNSEIPNSLLIWQKIVSIALCSSETKSNFKHWRLKEFHLNWEEFLNVAMEKRISPSKHKIESSLDLNAKIETWKEIFLKVGSSIEKDLKVFDKIVESSSSSLDSISDYISWEDFFIHAVKSKTAGKVSYELNVPTLIEKTLLNQSVPSWNEIFYVMSKYHSEDLIKRCLEFTSDFKIAEEEKMLLIKEMTYNVNFNWDALILDILEQLLSSDSDEITLELKPKLSLFDEVKKAMGIEIDTSKKSDVASWIDLLPGKEWLEKLQNDDNPILFEAKSRNTSQKTIKIPYNFLWENIFPMSVLIWKKDFEGYLNFNSTTVNDGEFGSKFDSSIPESSGSAFYEDNRLDDDNNSFNFKELEPEFLQYAASWREIYLAAVERYQTILSRLIELDKNSKQSADERESDKPESRHQKVYSAKNVLNIEITLPDLFQAVSILKKENAVSYIEPELVAVSEMTEIEQEQNENLEAADVIQSFSDIIFKGLVHRRKERKFVQDEIFKLTSVLEKDESILDGMSNLTRAKEYLSRISRRRKAENKVINEEFEKLGELKSLFSGYFNSAGKEPIEQINVKCIQHVNQTLGKFKSVETDHNRKLLNHRDQCSTFLQHCLNERQLERFQLNSNTYERLTSLLNKEVNTYLVDSGQIVKSIISHREEEIRSIQNQMKNLKKVLGSTEELEKMVSGVLKSVESFLWNGLSKKSTICDDLIEVTNIVCSEKEELMSKIRKEVDSCKEFIYDSIKIINEKMTNLKTEVDILNSSMENKNKNTLEVLMNCKQLHEKIIERIESELNTLNSYLERNEKSQNEKLYSMCEEFFVSAISMRRSEISEIKLLSDPLQDTGEYVDAKVCVDNLQGIKIII